MRLISHGTNGWLVETKSRRPNAEQSTLMNDSRSFGGLDQTYWRYLHRQVNLRRFTCIYGVNMCMDNANALNRLNCTHYSNIHPSIYVFVVVTDF